MLNPAKKGRFLQGLGPKSAVFGGIFASQPPKITLVAPVFAHKARQNVSKAQEVTWSTL